jgi:hypothetical protein
MALIQNSFFFISEKNKGRPVWNKGMKTPEEKKKVISITYWNLSNKRDSSKEIKGSYWLEA